MYASIIIPVRNGERHIASCIEALQKQDFNKSYEIIVVDDGSTDKTAEVVKKFKDVILIKQKPSGPAKARNNGAKHAKGKIVLFIDSDCIADKNWLKEMLMPFKEDNVGGVQGAYKTKQKSIVARFVQLEIEERYQKMLKSKDLDWIGSYSAAYRKDLFDKLGGFDERFQKASGEDPELSYRAQKLGYKLVFNPGAIVYHTHPEKLSVYLRKKFQHAYWRILLYRLHRDKAIKDSYTPQTLKLQILFLALTIIFSFLALFIKWFFMFAMLSMVLIFLFMLPSLLFISRQDPKILAFTPIFLLLRDFAFLFGLTAGTIRFFCKGES